MRYCLRYTMTCSKGNMFYSSRSYGIYQPPSVQHFPTIFYRKQNQNVLNWREREKKKIEMSTASTLSLSTIVCNGIERNSPNLRNLLVWEGTACHPICALKMPAWDGINFQTDPNYHCHWHVATFGPHQMYGDLTLGSTEVFAFNIRTHHRTSLKNWNNQWHQLTVFEKVRKAHISTIVAIQSLTNGLLAILCCKNAVL